MQAPGVKERDTEGRGLRGIEKKIKSPPVPSSCGGERL
jgi:hypothetical protein